MAYAGVQMFMEKLKQLINCNDNPLINIPSIIDQRPQFQLLYEELGSMIQTLFIDQHQDLHDLEKVSDLKQRFIHAAEEAEYIVDLYLSGGHNRNNGDLQTYEDFKRSQHRDDVRRSFKRSNNMFLSCFHIRYNGHDYPTSWDFKQSLKLDDVRRSLKSVEVEFMNMNFDRKKMDLSPRPQTTLNQSDAVAQSSISRNSLGSKKLSDEIFVGIDRDAELIRDKLVEDQKKLDVVSIVGMGGIGKTTLATKVFNDGFVKYHFHVRVWVTVSQTYDKRAVLTQILESIRAQLNLIKDTDSAIHEKVNKHHDLEKANDSLLRELVHKNLMGKRYLIVIDDIWHTETWDNLKLFFPHENNGSRILLTSRLIEVAKHAYSDGLIHHLGCLNKERCWKLLCHKVFHGSKCPEWSIKPGMQIVESCRGLPLAVVVIAGVLAKEAWSERFWVEIAKQTGLYIVGDQNGCMEILGLSYSQLPLHLRECFLYFGGFPEDFMYKVKRLIWLWVAEGFIEQDGNRSLEEIAEGYLIDLIDKNLVIVDKWRSNGGVKACKVHDLVRELCLKKAQEERFNLKIETLTLPTKLSEDRKPPYRPERMFIDKAMAFPPAQNYRSILVFGYGGSLGDDIPKHFRSFVMLRVLDFGNFLLYDFPKGMELLVHLRYLAIWISSKVGFPSSICNLWNLQTLIYMSKEMGRVVLPSNISDLVNLRHLRNGRNFKRLFNNDFVLYSIERPMKLQTIIGMELIDGVDNFQKCFPYVKELRCKIYLFKLNDFKSLTYLEKLSVESSPNAISQKKSITFPATLKTLALKWCNLAWSEMSIIQSLPNLQVLNLKHKAFEGSCWNTDGQEFPQLKFLRLEGLDIKQCKANSRSFPCLRQLQIINCYHLEEIPLEIGDIPTLELIKIRLCNASVGESVRRIEEEQRDLGNYDLRIHIEDEYNRGILKKFNSKPDS